MDTKGYFGKDTLATIRVTSAGASVALDDATNIHTNCGKGVAPSSDLVCIGWYYSNYRATFDSYGTRFYSRALSDEEVLWNAMIDRHRFTDTALEEGRVCGGRRVNGNKVEMRSALGVVNPEAGEVSLTYDGVETIGTATNWYEISATKTMTYKAMPANGETFLHWSSDTDVLTCDQLVSATLILTNDRPHSLLAVFKGGGMMAPTARKWTGIKGDGQWDSFANWQPAGVPAEGDDITIDDAQVTLTNATANLASFTLKGTTAKLTFEEATRAAPENCVTVLNATNVYVQEGATITHAPNMQTRDEYKSVGEWQLDGRVNINCVNMTLDATSKINVNERGYYFGAGRYSPGVGPGSNNDNNSAYFGASSGHGGWGAGSFTLDDGYEVTKMLLTGNTYDSLTEPSYPGTSGVIGNDVSGYHGLQGGGVVKIKAAGRLTLNGVIGANGAADTQDQGRYTGSGGSVWLDTGSIAGSGSITAHAGSSTYRWDNNRSGGGGRISVTYNKSEQDAQDQANGVPTLKFGAKPISEGQYAKRYSLADIGTVYFTDDRFLGEVFDGTKGVQYGQIFCGEWTKWHPNSLTVSDSWIRFPNGSGTNLTLSGEVKVTGTYGRLEIGGEKYFPWVYSLRCKVERKDRTNRVRLMSLAPVRLSCGKFTVDDGATFAMYAGITNGVDAVDGGRLDVAGEFKIGNNGFVLLSCHPTNGAIVKVTAASANICTNGTLSSAGHGWVCYQLEGSTTITGGIAPGKPDYVRADWFAPSHGGAGTHYRANLTALPYDSLIDPVMPGSSGMVSYYRYGAGNGGGVIHLTTTGKITVDGLIDVAGQGEATISLKGSTGSGGSVNLNCQTIAGGGTVDASGGVNEYSESWDVGKPNGCGAGGRISVRYDRALQKTSGNKVNITWQCNSRQKPIDKYDNRSNSQVGTIYFSDAQFLGENFCAGGVQSGEVHCGDWSDWRPNNLTADGGAVNVRLVSDGLDFNIPGNLSVLNGASLGFGGGTNWITRPYRYGVFSPANAGAVVRVGGSLKMNDTKGKNELHVFAGDGCTVSSEHEDIGGLLQIGRRVYVGTNSWIYPHCDPYVGKSVRIVAGSKVQIREKAGIDASGFGFSGGINPVYQWTNMGYGPGHGWGRGSGGAYGGIGGASVGSAQKVKPLPGYGLVDADGVPLWMRPTKPGSGASNGDNGIQSAGGGTVWLETRSSLELAGSLLSDADSNVSISGWNAGGSGGGIYVKCCRWKPTANALVRARGYASTSGGAGGGGCIAIWRSVDLDSIVSTNERTYVSAPAGHKNNNIQQATDGTVYWDWLPFPSSLIMLK